MQDERKRLPDILRTIAINAEIEKVWKAVSTSEGLANWLMPNTFKAEVNARFTMQSAPRGEWNGCINCVVKELLPPTKLGFSWSANGLDQYVTFELSDCGGKTKLTMVHSGWYEGLEEIRDTMYKGWGHLLEGLQTKQEEKDRDADE